MKPTLEEVLNMANELTPSEYLEYCDQINMIVEERDLLTNLVHLSITDFSDEEKNRMWNLGQNLICIDVFHPTGYWLDSLNCREGHCTNLTEPGAYCEIHDIIAVNRSTGRIWAFYELQCPPVIRNQEVLCLLYESSLKLKEIQDCPDAER